MMDPGRSRQADQAGDGEGSLGRRGHGWPGWLALVEGLECARVIDGYKLYMARHAIITFS